MLKIALMATFTAASTLTAAADPATAPRELSRLSPDIRAQVVKLQTYGHRFDKAIDGILAEASMQDYRWDDIGSTRDLSILSPEVRAHVVRLQSYGHRFDKAIDAILLEAKMQQYRSGDCGLGEIGTGVAPQS